MLSTFLYVLFISFVNSALLFEFWSNFDSFSCFFNFSISLFFNYIVFLESSSSNSSFCCPNSTSINDIKCNIDNIINSFSTFQDDIKENNTIANDIDNKVKSINYGLENINNDLSDKLKGALMV
jgi:hypothetical protein